MLLYAAEKDNHCFVVLLSQQPVSCHVNVAPLGITVPLYDRLSVGLPGLFLVPCNGSAGEPTSQTSFGRTEKFLQKTLDKPQRICDTTVTEANDC